MTGYQEISCQWNDQIGTKHLLMNSWVLLNDLRHLTVLGSILTLAIFGTAISALVIGAGVYILGVAGLVYELTIVESFAFGSLISAVDPVATLAIFQVYRCSFMPNLILIICDFDLLKLWDDNFKSSKSRIFTVWKFVLFFNDLWEKWKISCCKYKL